MSSRVSLLSRDDLSSSFRITDLNFFGKGFTFLWGTLPSFCVSEMFFRIHLCLLFLKRSLLLWANFLWMMIFSSRSHCLCLGFLLHLMVNLLSSSMDSLSSYLALSTDLVVLHHHGSVSPFYSCSSLGGSNWKFSSFGAGDLHLVWDFNSLRFGVLLLLSDKLSSSFGFNNSLLDCNVVFMKSSVFDFFSDLLLSFVEGLSNHLDVLVSLVEILLNILVGLPDLMLMNCSSLPCFGHNSYDFWLCDSSLWSSELNFSYLLLSNGFSLSSGCRCSS